MQFWDEVESSTIVKCFSKAEDIDSTVESETADDIDDTVPLKLVSLAHELFGCDFSERVELRQAIPTCVENMDWDKPASELLKELVHDTETGGLTIVTMKMKVLRMTHLCVSIMRLRNTWRN